MKYQSAKSSVKSATRFGWLDQTSAIELTFGAFFNSHEEADPSSVR